MAQKKKKRVRRRAISTASAPTPPRGGIICQEESLGSRTPSKMLSEPKGRFLRFLPKSPASTLFPRVGGAVTGFLSGKTNSFPDRPTPLLPLLRFPRCHRLRRHREHRAYYRPSEISGYLTNISCRQRLRGRIVAEYQRTSVQSSPAEGNTLLQNCRSAAALIHVRGARLLLSPSANLFHFRLHLQSASDIGEHSLL